VNAAIRDENILVIVVNNAVHAMTGGQEALTTPWVVVGDAPRDVELHRSGVVGA
jgi:pyruvate/2-oxoacid:ferredoxin oxidoreductase beta subunit